MTYPGFQAQQISSWRATNNELWDLAATISSFIGGPLGPLAVWGLKFVYDRRNLIFSQLGIPIQAYTAQRVPLRLTSLATPNRAAAQAPAGTLSISAPLTSAARQLGLRSGDPVSVVLAGHQYVQARSGLVVSTRIGERIEVWVPNGNYTVAAFGGRRDALFATPDPYSTMTGGNILLAGRRQLNLSLTARNAVAPIAPRIAQGGPGCSCPQCTPRLSPAALMPYPRRADTTLWDRFVQFLNDL